MPNNCTMDEQLIQEMRETAEILEKCANDESLLLDKTASISALASSSRSEYMDGVIAGLGLEG